MNIYFSFWKQYAIWLQLLLLQLQLQLNWMNESGKMHLVIESKPYRNEVKMQLNIQVSSSYSSCCFLYWLGFVGCRMQGSLWCCTTGNLLRAEMNFAQHELCFIKKNSLQDSIKMRVCLPIRTVDGASVQQSCGVAKALLKIFLVARKNTQTNTHTHKCIEYSLAYVLTVGEVYETHSYNNNCRSSNNNNNNNNNSV